MKNSSRNFGVDLLRIVSMTGVVFLHILGHGGILNLELSPAKFLIVWFLEILFYPAVNCFVLISGYVGYKGENYFPKIKNLLTLMFTVIFYSVSIFLIFALIGIEPLGIAGLVKSFFPTILNGYWFFSAYVGLFLLTPLLNLLVHKSNLKHAFIFMLVFSLFSIISTIYDTFSLLRGYSVIWFVFMYLIGAIIKKYDLNKLFSRKVWLLISFSAFILTLLSKIILNIIPISMISSHSSLLIKYVSPLIVIMAVALFNFFSQIKCPPWFTSAISFFASSAFSVYLIHDNIYVRNYLISKLHEYIGGFNFVLLPLSIILIALAIFLICILIDKIRMKIFKALKIDSLAEKIEKFIKTTLNTIYIKIEKFI